MLEWLAILVALALVMRQSGRLDAMESRAERLEETIRALRAQLAKAVGGASSPAAPARSAAESVRVAPPAPAAVPVAARPVVPQPPRPAAPPAPPVVASEADASLIGVSPAIRAKLRAADAAREAHAAAGDATVPPARPPRPPAPPAPPEEPSAPFDWEKLIGVKLFSWIAGAALALAGVFFLRYSLDSGWLRPEVRMAIGLLTGVALLVVCEMKAARRYPQTANAMDASGIALLFATVFASFALWHLIPALAAFALLVLVTGVAVLLSVRRDSMFIAALGLLGGFATPALLASGHDDPIGLFSYLLLLNVGLAWVAYRRRWPLLTALSLAASTIYQWGWVMKYLTAEKLPIAVVVFLLFPAVWLVALALGGRAATGDADGSSLRNPLLFSRAAQVSAAIPLFLALHLAAVPAYGSHFGILFGFLACLAAGLFVVAIFQGPRELHALGAAGTIITMAIWLTTSYAPAAWPWVLGIVAGFVLFYLAAPAIAERWRGRPLEGVAALAALAGPVLLFAFPGLVSMEARAASPALPFGVLFVLLLACAAYAIRRGSSAAHYIAAFFALGAEAVWTARYLDATRLYEGLGLFALFGLFYVGTPIAARRWQRPLRPAGGAGVLTLASLAVLLLLASGRAADSALWGLALLIAMLNVGLYIESSAGRMPALSFVGAALSWLVLGVWWNTAHAAAIVPALFVMAGFAVLTMVGNAIARRRTGDAPGTLTGFDASIYMGLVGHVFLAFVVTRPELSIPPWPVLGALAVLDLAVLVVALYLRNGVMTVASTVATAMILMLWTTVARVAPWPLVAVVAAGASAALAFAALPLARRVGAHVGAFGVAAGAAVVLAQGALVVACLQPGAPSLAFVAIAQGVLACAALSLAWTDDVRLEWAAVASALMAGAVGLAWGGMLPVAPAWSAQLIVSLAGLLPIALHPLVLGRRARDPHAPYVAAVAAHVLLFLLARHALTLGGFRGYMGALPLVQALLLLPVLRQLVRYDRTEDPSRPHDGMRMASARLALIAGATLACVTVAIPLQLDKNWITIGWALEGAALLWLVRRIRHPGLLATGVALLGAAFVRLTLNPAVLSYHPRGAMPILNWYLYTYLLVAAALFAGAWLAAGDARKQLTGLLATAGTILLFLLLNIEIADYYAAGATITFNFSANLAQDLSYTIGWALFSLGLLAAGIVMKNKPCRIASIALLVVTVLKCFLHDLGRLGGLYRVGSFVGLALCLSLVAIVLQRFVLARDEPRLGPA